MVNVILYLNRESWITLVRQALHVLLENRKVNMTVGKPVESKRILTLTINYEHNSHQSNSLGMTYLSWQIGILRPSFLSWIDLCDEKSNYLLPAANLIQSMKTTRVPSGESPNLQAISPVSWIVRFAKNRAQFFACLLFSLSRSIYRRQKTRSSNHFGRRHKQKLKAMSLDRGPFKNCHLVRRKTGDEKGHSLDIDKGRQRKRRREGRKRSQSRFFSQFSLHIPLSRHWG